MEDKHIKHITSNGEIYASIFDISNMPEGLDFLTNDESFIQVGTWNYKKDKILDLSSMFLCISFLLKSINLYFNLVSSG